MATVHVPTPVSTPQAPAPVLVQPPPPRRRTRWAAVALLALLAFAAGYFLFQRVRPGARGVQAVRTTRVVRGELQRTLRVSGMVGARAFAPIVAPRLSGRGMGDAGQMILIKLAPAGSKVKKGDVIAEFDRQWQLNRIDDQEAQVVQAEADINKRRAELSILRQASLQTLRVAKAEMDKARLDLKTAEVRSAIDAEKLKLAVEETAARYKQMESEVPLMEASHAADIRALGFAR